MRAVLALALALALAACGGSSPPPPHTQQPPDRAKLEAMSFDDSCSAVAPRAKPCMDELIVANAASLGQGSDFAALVSEHVESAGESSARELDVMHRAECAANEDYAFAVLTCWSRTDCKQFATCVMSELAKTPHPARGR